MFMQLWQSILLLSIFFFFFFFFAEWFDLYNIYYICSIGRRGYYSFRVAAEGGHYSRAAFIGNTGLGVIGSVLGVIG